MADGNGVSLDVLVFLPIGQRPIPAGGSCEAVCDFIDQHPEATGISVVYNGVSGTVFDGDVPREFWFMFAAIRAIQNSRYTN